MGCDIHMRVEARRADAWWLAGREFDSTRDRNYLPASRGNLEDLTDGQILDGLAWEGRSLEQVKADKAERQRAARERAGRGERGLFGPRDDDLADFDPDRDDYHRAFREALPPEAQDLFARWNARLDADREITSKAYDDWRAWWREHGDQESHGPIPDDHQMTHGRVVKPVEDRVRSDRHRETGDPRSPLFVSTALREAIIHAADGYRPWSDDDEDDDGGRVDITIERAHDDPPFKVEEPYSGRNYDLFAMLADVRNGGFRGEPQRIDPIDRPRGVPDDASDEGHAFMESYGVDGHSHSYLTLAELQAVDWTGGEVRQWGIVDEATFLALRGDGTRPRMWSGGSWGVGTRMFTPGGYDAWVARGRPAIPEAKGRSWLDNDIHIDPPMLAALVNDEVPRREPGDDPLRAGPGLHGEAAPSGAEPFGLVAGEISVRTDATDQVVIDGPPEPITRPQIRATWSETWAESAGDFVRHTIPELERFAHREGLAPDDVRIVFFFDN